MSSQISVLVVSCAMGECGGDFADILGIKDPEGNPQQVNQNFMNQEDLEPLIGCNRIPDYLATAFALLQLRAKLRVSGWPQR